MGRYTLGDNVRKLVTIQKIVALYPIKGADFIETAQVLGWSLIVKKGEFKKGDLCVFFEIDSFLPVDSKYEFLGKPKNYLGKPGHRLKTIKMRGVISQGLALPYDLFTQSPDVAFIEGEDWTEHLGVVKYDIDLVKGVQGSSPKTGDQAGRFPSFIPKTDEERIQNLPHYFSQYKDMLWEETLKLDGSSCTMYSVEGKSTWIQKALMWLGFDINVKSKFGVCSRNIDLKDPSEGVPIGQRKTSNFWAAAVKYNIAKTLPTGYAVQGELIAPNIQSNHEKVDDVEFHVFNIYDIRSKRNLTPEERMLMEPYMGQAPHIKVINKAVKIFTECPTLEDLLARVDTASINPGTISEGRVYKSTTVHGLSFKVINNKYLLKCED